MLGSTWKERISGNVTTWPLISPHGGDTGTDCAGTVGTGIVPSTPTRKLFSAGLEFAGSHPGPPAALKLQRGVGTFNVCANPMPSEGMITLWTVFWRS